MLSLPATAPERWCRRGIVGAQHFMSILTIWLQLNHTTCPLKYFSGNRNEVAGPEDHSDELDSPCGHTHSMISHHAAPAACAVIHMLLLHSFYHDISICGNKT